MITNTHSNSVNYGRIHKLSPRMSLSSYYRFIKTLISFDYLEFAMVFIYFFIKNKNRYDVCCFLSIFILSVPSIYNILFATKYLLQPVNEGNIIPSKKKKTLLYNKIPLYFIKFANCYPQLFQFFVFLF